MINIEKGRYWDLPWSLVSGCTPCSPGCDHCWSAAMASRFHSGDIVNGNGKFNGQIVTHPERLDIPRKRRKHAVYAIWNDLHHESVGDSFKVDCYFCMRNLEWHTFLILTKRPKELLGFYHLNKDYPFWPLGHIYHGLTVCNQSEADAKIPVFLQVPGKKFLSIEPMLEPVDIEPYLRCPVCCYSKADQDIHWDHHLCKGENSGIPCISVILGGETGPGARPVHPDWVRSVRDQCEAAGVPFFFKQWGAFGINYLMDDDMRMIPGSEWMDKGVKPSGRLLDGRTHDDLPWVTPC
jgi:protein gp37